MCTGAHGNTNVGDSDTPNLALLSWTTMQSFLLAAQKMLQLGLRVICA